VLRSAVGDEGEATLTPAAAAVHLFVSLIVLVNPPLVVPLFLNLTKPCTPDQRRGVAVTAAVAVCGIFAIAALLGAEVLAALNIDINALRGAGGLLLALLAIDMVWPRPPPAAADGSAQSPAIVPIAFPMLAGPGSIAVVIAAAANYPSWEARVLIFAVIGTIALVALVALLLAVPIYRLLGDAGLDVLSKIMCMLLLGVGLEMLVDGLGGLLPGLMK
jgi:multiple antibiotic resistance protein